MDKNELMEFVKLFKKAQEQEDEEGEEEEDIENHVNDDEEGDKYKKKESSKSSWFDAFEDLLLTILILFTLMIYFYLLARGQISILQKEIEKFKESQKIVHLAVFKFFDETYETEEIEYKAERFKYDKYAAKAKDELKLDWKALGKSENKCTNDLMKETAEQIQNQIKLIKKLNSNSISNQSNQSNNTVKPNTTNTTNTVNTGNTVNLKFHNFEEFKSLFQSPPTKESLSFHNNFNFNYLKLDEIYIKQIIKYFKFKFSKIHLEIFDGEDDSTYFKSKQQILFLKQLQTESKENVTIQPFNKKIQTLLKLKEEAIQDFDGNLKNILNDLKTLIESVPIYPKMKISEPVKTKNVQIIDSFITFFEKLYSKLQL